MYVIFPADELILLTYAPIKPGRKRRPTLDCIRKPLVSSVCRSFSPTVQQATSKQDSSVPHKYLSTLPQISETIPMHNSVYNDSSNTNRFRRRESSSTAIDSYGQNEAETSFDERYPDEYETSRDRSPSIYLDPDNTDASSSRPTSPSTKPKSKSKLRPKLKISLGPLRRQQQEKNEISRIREDLHLQVENPTFTCENLRDRNFDAFFQSGEPVYKLHPKPASTTNLEALTPSIDCDGGAGEIEKSSRLGIFGRSKKPPISRSKSADCDANDKASIGVPQKSDRLMNSNAQKTTTKQPNSTSKQKQNKSQAVKKPPSAQTSFEDDPQKNSSFPSLNQADIMATLNDSEDPYQDSYNLSRERSPSIFIEPPSPDYNSRRPAATSSSKTSSQQTKTKNFPKLKISLGRLGRQQRDQYESNRLREDLDLHVENPTFTRENILARNFDAFFESGEPVYKLQPKPTSPSNLESQSLSASISFDAASGGYDRIGSQKPGSKEPLISRSKSADYDTSEKPTTDEPPKDFCRKSSDGRNGRSFFGSRGLYVSDNYSPKITGPPLMGY